MYEIGANNLIIVEVKRGKLIKEENYLSKKKNESRMEVRNYLFK